MTKIEYTSIRPTVQMGVPYTWGNGANWYMKTNADVVVCLNSGATINTHIHKDVTSYTGFRYATSMELK